VTAYFGLSLFFTYPAVTNLSQLIIGGNDANSHLWLGWWFHQAVFHLRKNPLAWSDYLYYPNGFRLGASYDGLFFPIFSALAQLVVANQLLIYNIYCLLALSFSALSVYLLVTYLTTSSALAFLAGVAVGFSPYQIAHLLGGHTNLIAFGWVPLFFLAYLRVKDSPSTRNVLYCSAALFLVGVGSWSYLAFTGVGLLCLLSCEYWLNFRGFVSPYLFWLRKIRIYHWLLIAFCGLLPLSLPIVQGFLTGETALSEGSSYVFGGADGSSFFLPAPRSNLGQLLSTSKIFARYHSFNETEAVTFLGWLEVLAAVGLFVIRGFSHLGGRGWFWSALIFLTLSLGDRLRWLGQAYAPLPYALLMKFPGASWLRVPARLAIFVLLFLVVWLSINTAEFFESATTKKRRWVWIVLLLALVGERLWWPLPMLKEPVSLFYEVIRNDQAEFAVANLPNFEASDRHAFANYTQTLHHRKIAGGYISSFSLTTRVGQFLIDNPALYHSFCPSFTAEKANRILKDQPVDALFTALKASNIRYLILHLYLLQNPDCFVYSAFIDDYLQTKPVFYEDDLIRVYQTTD